ncbi:MAG: cobyrinic acid a,c-diamide synthase [Cellvibrionaceae bacterium]
MVLCAELPCLQEAGNEREQERKRCSHAKITFFRGPIVKMALNNSVSCPALFLSAPASGQGKTTITAALARLLKRQGKTVRIFKTGPDYLDPQILAQASGQDVVPLDMWMAGEEWCQDQLYRAAQTADLILIEGAMGLFDGEPSSADLAVRFSIPVAIVIDVKGMAQTVAAVAMGLAGFRNDVQIAGLIANNCGSDRHRELIEGALPEDLPLLFTVARSETMALPERHLGLVQANEVKDELEQRFENGADCLEKTDAINIVEQIKPVEFIEPKLSENSPSRINNKPLATITVAIAKDKAFSFIYDANVSFLKDLGAEIIFFSPISEAVVPHADALWLPGGYPELHAQELSQNVTMLESINVFFNQQKTILAECGGFLYTLDTLTDLSDTTYSMAGLLKGEGAMRGKRGCQGMQTAPLPEGEIRGHAHHRSRSVVNKEPVAYGRRQRHPAPGEAIYREKKLTATYLHLFFPSNPEATIHLFLAGKNAQTQENGTLALMKSANAGVNSKCKSRV